MTLQNGTPFESTFQEQVEAALRSRVLIDRLAQWRAECGLPQAEVARRMHTSQPSVARIESHQHDPQLSTLARYVTALGLSLNFVLTGSKSRARIWDSEDELEPGNGISTSEARQPETANKLEMPGLVIVDGIWDSVSEYDLEHHPCLITASKESGWSLVYINDPAVSGEAMPGFRAEKAIDQRVLGVFELKGDDPIAITKATEPDSGESRAVHFLVAKLKDPGIAEFRTYHPARASSVESGKSSQGSVDPARPSVAIRVSRQRLRQSGRGMAPHRITERDLVDVISGRVGGRKAATEALNAILETIQASVASGDKVALSGFGIFEKAKRPSRIPSPATGTSLEARGSGVPNFRAGSEFKALVKKGEGEGRRAKQGGRSTKK
jgi:DNA-binding protein HU-beta